MAMQPGDRIATKSLRERQHDLPFENNDLPVASMDIKARGVIQSVEKSRVLMDWDSEFIEREWYFYTGRRKVWHLDTAFE